MLLFSNSEIACQFWCLVCEIAKCMITKVLAVVVTYYPDEELLTKNIQAFIHDVDKVLIWENTPELKKIRYRFIQHKKIEYCGDGINSIARALNYAWRYAEENRYDYLLTMDQDSLFQDFPSYKNTVLAHCPGKDAIYGPNYSDKPIDPIQEKHYTITSGMMLPVSVLNAVGGYDEFFAVDGLDMDLCLKARQKGIKTYVIRDSIIKHKFGNPISASFWGHKVLYSSYPPKRLYNIYKTHILLIRKYKSDELKNEFCFICLRKMPRNVILFEKEKVSKLWAILKGIVVGSFLRIDRGKI